MPDRHTRGLELLINLTAGTAPFLLRALMGSCRITVQNKALFDDAIRGTPYIGALWHQYVPVYMDLFRRSRFAVMVSRSKDGEIAARVLRRLGIDSIRGSSSRGGKEALQEMIATVRNRHTVAFIADGPRGPARVAKIGAVIAARETGRPIVPLACAVAPAFRARSWDRMVVPWPGSHIVVRFGEPIPVPPDASHEQCELIRRDLQEAITREERVACAAL
ncbi:MAG: lysophospholipid acyltransferase family protein [Planctomycetes bacterium]|nr:lysophospholipid acyltransferase family protein [Planctomycetota bacterium]